MERSFFRMKTVLRRIRIRSNADTAAVEYRTGLRLAVLISGEVSVVVLRARRARAAYMSEKLWLRPRVPEGLGRAPNRTTVEGGGR